MKPFPLSDEEIVPGEWQFRILQTCSEPGHGAVWVRELGPGGVPVTAHWRCRDCLRAPNSAPPVVKLSNPKDEVSGDKLPLHVLPLPALIQWALAHTEGRLKYGGWNWVVAGARSTVYVSAAMRHLLKWTFGQESEPVTGVHHLGSVMACCAILIDTQYRGVLNDDRPPPHPDLDGLISQGERVLAGLIRLYGDRNPKHYTRADV